MEYAFVIIFASAFVLAIFWFVAKTVGKLNVVRNSPTLDDINSSIFPDLAEERNRDAKDYSLNAESLSKTVRALADDGDKLGATMAYKQGSGVSLMEAKRTVEAYLRNRDHER